MSDFAFPECYSWPPFWTLQSNAAQRQKQIELWSNLICAYMKKKHLYEFNVSDADEMDLFRNKEIARSLSRLDLITILDDMTGRSNAMWLDPAKSKVRIYWRSLDEWGQLMWKWADDNAFYQIMTLEDVRHDSGQFADLPLPLMADALRRLAAKGKAKFVEKPRIGECGVKFLEE